MDFDTAEDLAKYLKYLDKNSTAYNEYFKWKRHIKSYSKRVFLSQLCDMCIKLNLEDFFGVEQQTARSDFALLWRRSNCKKPVPNDYKFFNLETLIEKSNRKIFIYLSKF